MPPWDLAELGVAALYAAVFGLIFVESGLLVGIVFPGDTVLFTAGLLCAGLDSAPALPLMAATVLVAAVLGDSLGYGLGRRLGRAYLLRGLPKRGRRVLDKTERLYRRHGWFAVVTARWIPWARTIVPVLAGAGHMPYGRFLAANILGAALWAVGLVMLGYASHFVPWAYEVSLAAMGVGIVVIVGYGVRQRLLRTRAPAAAKTS
ncbi:MAG: DedA family protein [Stackebrandtia sp.]